MNRPGPGPQPLRAMPGGMFPSQQASNRGAPMTSGRLQNGKLGSGSNWGFGMPMGGAPGLSNAQSRNNPNLSSFAQTIGGGSQQHTPLDPSEFPSLSGAPQQQQQNSSSQATWSNSNLRQHTPVQRAPGQGGGVQGPTPPSSHQGQQQQQPNDDGAHGSQLASGVDDYRFGGQGGVGQLSGASQPQTGNVEEFPPLGGAGGGESGQDRRSNMIQNAASAYANNLNGSAFGGTNHTRNGLIGMGQDGQPDRDGRAANQQVAQDMDRNRARNLNNTPFQGYPGPLELRDNRQSQQPPFGQQGQVDHSYSTELVESPSAGQQRSESRRISQMNELDRFGLPGLLAMIPNEGQDHSSLAVGQDLTVLGLDLTQPDDSPLYPSFGTPFSETTIRQTIPDFTLPPAYIVTNVSPMHSKLSSFSDETLFAIFYQYPRDILQEMAASELYTRDWRWHKELRQWMMKDTSFSAPMRLDEKQERGFYVFFDVNNWRRERREFVLNYEHLDQRHAPVAPVPGAGPSL